MFLIGEFSKISQVSKRLLHYYDDIGLLKPAQVDQATGYRYYSAKQLPRLNRILALKDLGLTLDQITKTLQADVSDDEITGMLMMKKAEMEQTVFEDMQRIRRIEARLQQNQTADEAPDIVIKSIPAQPFLSVRLQASTEEEMLQLVEQLLQAVPAKVGRGVLGSFAGVFQMGDAWFTDDSVELGYFLNKPVERPIRLTEEYLLRMRELPSVDTMATIIQEGNRDLEFVPFGKIARWIEGNGYRIAGPFREIGFDVGSLSDLQKAVVEIQMPVEKEGLPSALRPILSD